jgi:hypothetical protein
MVLNATFNNNSATLWHFSFIGEGNRSTWRIPPTQGLFGTNLNLFHAVVLKKIFKGFQFCQPIRSHGSYHGCRTRSLDIILDEDHSWSITSKFGPLVLRRSKCEKLMEHECRTSDEKC